MKRKFRASLRQRLLVPIILIMVVCVSGLFLTIVSVQNGQLNKLSDSVRSALDTTNRIANENYAQLEQDVTVYLEKMNGTLNTSIAETTRGSLEEEKSKLETEFNAALQQNAESLAGLLVQVAPAAILANNFIDLIGYAKSATQNADIVYAIYIKPDGKPLTRYLDRQSKLIQKYLKTGKEKNKALRVIAASKGDDNVLLVEKPILFEGKDLGKVFVCVDKASAREKIAALSERFGWLINANADKGKTIIQEESAKLSQRIDEKLNNVSSQSLASINDITKTLQTASNSVRSKTQGIALLAALISGIVVAVLLFIILSRIAKSIGRITTDLDQRSDNITAASEQVASASRQLAEGASEQAASIEETSSSLEEMDSMTRQNADNAGQANHVMQETTQVVSEANRSMEELTTSMAEISEASTETSKIIKTIDEIAFQTNLLALNAAVEAARAGEAGAGFAVVADEVRNLAIRAADAAKNTAELIDVTVSKVDTGKGLVSQCNASFGQVAQSASKVSELVAEIAAASKEQAQGIGQVNAAVTEMDKVVQQNASGAEETSSASEEMRMQADEMKAMLDELVITINGSKHRPLIEETLKDADEEIRLNQSASQNLWKPQPERQPGEWSQPPAKEASPVQVIPLDDDDLNELNLH